MTSCIRLAIFQASSFMLETVSQLLKAPSNQADRSIEQVGDKAVEMGITVCQHIKYLGAHIDNISSDSNCSLIFSFKYYYHSSYVGVPRFFGIRQLDGHT